MKKKRISLVLAVILLFAALILPWTLSGCARKPQQARVAPAADVDTIEGGPDLPKGMPTERKK
jgi:hypothetical protein